jgi:hypothetical protein
MRSLLIVILGILITGFLLYWLVGCYPNGMPPELLLAAGAETEEAEVIINVAFPYDGEHVYYLGERCWMNYHKDGSHMVWVSLQDNNIGNKPQLYGEPINPDWWELLNDH